MALNGNPVPMICFSANNWIYGGEHWNATAYTAGSVPSTSAFAGTTARYNELGWLANQLFANPGNADLQIAIWQMLGLNDPFMPSQSSDPTDYNAVENWLTKAQNAVAGGYQTTDLFYIPTGPNLPTVNGTTPQPFIVHTPEPSILVLVIAGMLGFIALTRKRAVA